MPPLRAVIPLLGLLVSPAGGAAAPPANHSQIGVWSTALYAPPKPPEFHLPGPHGAAALGLAVAQFQAQGKASEHDAYVATELARVLTGGDADMQDTLSEDDITTLEREAFSKLVRQPKTIARIEHMLATGKPLRN